MAALRVLFHCCLVLYSFNFIIFQVCSSNVDVTISILNEFAFNAFMGYDMSIFDDLPSKYTEYLIDSGLKVGQFLILSF